MEQGYYLLRPCTARGAKASARAKFLGVTYNSRPIGGSLFASTLGFAPGAMPPFLAYETHLKLC